MKDEHNVILILVSSSKFNSLFRRFIKILDFICSSFFPEFQVFSVISFQSFILSLQDFTLCFQLSFRLIILLLPEFFIEALHGGSSRILFILQLFFKISLEVMIRQALLKIKHGAKHMFCFLESKHYSSCILKCNSFYLIIWGGVMSFLIILSSCFLIHKLSGMSN